MVVGPAWTMRPAPGADSIRVCRRSGRIHQMCHMPLQLHSARECLDFGLDMRHKTSDVLDT